MNNFVYFNNPVFFFPAVLNGLKVHKDKELAPRSRGRESSVGRDRNEGCDASGEISHKHTAATAKSHNTNGHNYRRAAEELRKQVQAFMSISVSAWTGIILESWELYWIWYLGGNIHPDVAYRQSDHHHLRY